MVPSQVVIPGAVGLMLSLLISIVNQEHWSSQVKGIVVIVSSAVAGLVTAIIQHSLSGVGWVQAIGIVWGAAVAAYTMFWQPTGIGPALERATTLKRGTN